MEFVGRSDTMVRSERSPDGNDAGRNPRLIDFEDSLVMRTFPGMRALGAGMAVSLSLALIGCSGGSTASKPATAGKESNGAKSSEAKPTETKPSEVGAAVKLETVTPDALQKKIESLQADEQPVLVDFWATWCVP
ncbi:MAG: hypothetical protein K1X38_07205, partial [Microthrixaceae bacterium]|nr:hypothetical protein [Microthrixaceae bacterium]